MKLTLLLLLNFLLRQIDYTFALALFAFGHERYTAIRCLVDGLVSVILASILVRYLGFEGVILGALCGAVLVSIPMDVFVLAREFEVSNIPVRSALYSVPVAIRPDWGRRRGSRHSVRDLRSSQSRDYGRPHWLGLLHYRTSLCLANTPTRLYPVHSMQTNHSPSPYRKAQLRLVK